MRALVLAVLAGAALVLGAGTSSAQTAECAGDQIHYEVYQGHPHHTGEVVHTITDDDHATAPPPPSAHVCVWPADAPQDDTSHAPDVAGAVTTAPDIPDTSSDSSSGSSSASSSGYDSSASAVSASDEDSGTADDAPARGGIVADFLDGFVLLGLALVPSLPARWRLGLVGLGVALLGFGLAGATSTSGRNHTLTAWDLALPVVAVAVALWGHWANQATSATATRPGRAPVDPAAVTAPLDLRGVPTATAPPAPPALAASPSRASVHGTPLTARARATVRLVATTSAPVDPVLGAVRAASQVRGNFFLVWGDAVVLEQRTADGFVCRAGATAVFRIVVTPAEGTTRLVAGGLERYTTARQYIAGFIPAGPASVQGFRAYKIFLTALAAELERLDPSARCAIGTPDQTPAHPPSGTFRQPA